MYGADEIAIGDGPDGSITPVAASGPFESRVRLAPGEKLEPWSEVATHSLANSHTCMRTCAHPITTAHSASWPAVRSLGHSGCAALQLSAAFSSEIWFDNSSGGYEGR